MANVFQNLFRRSSKLTVDEWIARRTLVSFTVFALFIAGAIIGIKALYRQRPTANGARPALRKILDVNEKVFSGLVEGKHLAKEYPKSAAVRPARVNGNYGMGADFDPSKWQLFVLRKPGDTLKLGLEDIKKLPKTEIVFNFKCIEGWSQITYWGGVKFSEFMKAFGLSGQEAMNYVGLSTPDKKYYVGLDMPSALHPQTLLCYELNGQALPMNQGYPLRLIVPTKYGVKSIKRIGTIYFDNVRPPDYWAERGYDYFSGL